MSCRRPTNHKYLPIALFLLLFNWSCSSDNSPVVNSTESNGWLLNPTQSFPQKLSDLGVFDDLEAEISSEGIVPYAVRYPLFSDYNAKSRYLFLPLGSRIDNTDPDNWVFPTGTGLIKTFYLTTLGANFAPRKKIETRVLHKGAGGWQAAVYQWNTTGGEAFKTDGFSIQIPFSLPGGPYDYSIPSRLSCLSCHRPKQDFVIGFEEIQLNTASPVDGSAQISYLRQLDLFLDAEALRAREIEAGNMREREAIGYIHGNCANCHHPSSPMYVTTFLDLRHGSFKENTIGVEPVKFQSFNSTLKIVQPGNVSESLIYLLMVDAEPNSSDRMPPIGTTMVDSVGVHLVQNWIENL
jgi:hypothetical protein